MHAVRRSSGNRLVKYKAHAESMSTESGTCSHAACMPSRCMVSLHVSVCRNSENRLVKHDLHATWVYRYMESGACGARSYWCAVTA